MRPGPRQAGGLAAQLAGDRQVAAVNVEAVAAVQQAQLAPAGQTSDQAPASARRRVWGDQQLQLPGNWFEGAIHALTIAKPAAGAIPARGSRGAGELPGG